MDHHITALAKFEANLPATIDEWRAKWAAVGKFERGRPWFYGDLFLQGRSFLDLASDKFYTWAEIAARILRKLPNGGIEPKTLINYALVAQAFPPDKRDPDVSWKIHRELVRLGSDAPRWLRRAKIEKWDVEDLRQALAETHSANGKLPDLSPGFIPRRAVTDACRWFRLQFRETPLDGWSRERRQAMRREFQPLLEILLEL